MLKKLSILSLVTIGSLTLNQGKINAITGDGGSTGSNSVSTKSEQSLQRNAVQQMNFFVNSGKIQKIPESSSRFKKGNNILKKLNTRNSDISNKLILSSNIDIEWRKTPASGMGDVAVSPSGRVWLAGKNGTIWYTDNGTVFKKIDGEGFDSISTNNNNILWAVGGNGTLWKSK